MSCTTLCLSCSSSDILVWSKVLKIKISFFLARYRGPKAKKAKWPEDGHRRDRRDKQNTSGIAWNWLSISRPDLGLELGVLVQSLHRHEVGLQITDRPHQPLQGLRDLHEMNDWHSAHIRSSRTTSGSVWTAARNDRSFMNTEGTGRPHKPLQGLRDLHEINDPSLTMTIITILTVRLNVCVTCSTEWTIRHWHGIHWRLVRAASGFVYPSRDERSVIGTEHTNGPCKPLRDLHDLLQHDMNDLSLTLNTLTVLTNHFRACVTCTWWTIIIIIIIIIYPLTARVVGAPHDDFATSFLHFFPVLHCPLGLGELQACPFPDVVFPPVTCEKHWTITRAEEALHCFGVPEGSQWINELVDF